MNIFDTNFLLEKHLSFLTIQSRDSGLIDLVQMKWSNPNKVNTSKEYKDLYISRIRQITNKFNKRNFTEIAGVSKSHDNYDVDIKQYTIRGVLKRLQAMRVRAFEKKFSQKYDGDNKTFHQMDEMQIEDETGKFKLFVTKETIIDIPNVNIGNLSDLPSGVVVQVAGKFRIKQNKFIAKRIVLPQLPPQQKISLNCTNHQGVAFKDKKILIVSQPNDQICNKIKQIISSPSQINQNIVSVIIIGGFDLKVSAIQKMAAFVQEIKNKIDVFLMPSSGIERQRMYPLQPYNGLYFIKSQTQIGLCSNPQLFQAQNGIKIHISCGQNVRDFMKNCSLAASEVKVLESLVRFGHYSPTCAYSLKTQPYIQDYLVMNEIPHVMITGKAQNFETNYVNFNGNKNCLFVSIPANSIGLLSLEGDCAKELL